MARMTENLKITTGAGEIFNYNISENYNEIFSKRQEVDNSNAFITLVTPDTDIGANTLRDIKAMIIKNNAIVAIEVQLKLTDYKDNSDVDAANSVDLGPGSATTTRNVSFMLAAGEFMLFPNARWVSYAEDTSAANAKPTTNGEYLTLDANEYVDTTIDIDNTTATNNVVGSATNTLVYLEQYTSAANCAANYFRVGDLIRLTNEILEVEAIGDKSDLANNTLTVKRGMYGTTAAGDHSDDDAVMLPFFNITGDFDKYTTVQTDGSGTFSCKNFFGYGRTTDKVSAGIVPGSIAGKFYTRGFQQLGLTDINAGTNSGLTASTTYYIKIAVDGGTSTEISFSTDSSNLNFGGKNGVLRKIQDALDVLYYDSSHAFFEKRIHASMSNGDIQFTSGQNLSTSSISLAAGTSGASAAVRLLAQQNGRIPALANIKGAVASKLPPDTIIDENGVTIPNRLAFFYDDGKGNINGSATGTINYDTGAFTISGISNAHFTITANYDSAHGGGNRTAANTQNLITEISARSCNSKIYAPVQVLAFN
mgnify:CR=1 FL=1